MLSVVTVLAIESVIYISTKELYNHLAQVFNSIWVFILGNFFAPSLKNQKQSVLWMMPFLVAVFVAEKVLPLSRICPIGGILYALKGIVLTVAASIVLILVKSAIVHKPLAWLGSMSLELYLTNIFCIQAMKYFAIDEFLRSQIGNRASDYIEYTLVVIFGVALSVLFHYSVKCILKRNTK